MPLSLRRAGVLVLVLAMVLTTLVGSTASASNHEADLSITKTDSPDPLVIDSGGTNRITYSIAVTNAGPATAAAVVVSDTVPTGTTFVSMSDPPSWNCVGPTPGPSTGTITCAPNSGSMAPGTASFQLVVEVADSTADNTTISNTATVTSTTPDPDTADRTATATTTVQRRANLSVTKTDSPDPVEANANITYTITVDSAGPTDAAGVTLTDAIPTGTTYVSLDEPGTDATNAWTCNTPSAGGTGQISCSRDTALADSAAAETFTLVVKVDPGTASGATITNTANLAATTTDPDETNNSATATTTVQRSSDVSVTKETTQTSIVVDGAPDEITYTITVENAGPQVATGVTLTDSVPANTTFVSLDEPGTDATNAWTCTTPAVGQTGDITCTRSGGLPVDDGTNPPEAEEFTLKVNVNGNTPSATTISNTATVSTTTVDPAAGNNSATATTTVVNNTTRMDVSVSKADSPDPVVASANITYTITATNNTPTTSAPGVVVTDEIPANTTFVSYNAPGWSCTVPAVGGTGTLQCALNDPLAQGTPKSITLVVKTSPATPASSSIVPNDGIANTAEVSADTQDPNPVNNEATQYTDVVRHADLSVTKTDSPDPVDPDKNIEYSISVTNNGPSNATAVKVDDTVPEGTSFVSAVGPLGWSCTRNTDTDLVTCANSDMAVGATDVLTLTVKVAANAAPGSTITNTATVSTDSTDGTASNNTDTENTTVGSANVSITKTGPATVPAGGQISYTITVNNAGPHAANNVTMSDSVPSSTTFVSLSRPAGWACTTPSAGGTGTVSCTMASLSANSPAQFTLVVAVGETVANGTTIVNVATVESDTADPVPGNNSAGVATDVDDPIFVRVGGDQSVAEGDSGTKAMNFTVTLSRAHSSQIVVSYFTEDGDATAGEDYVGVESGQVTFAAGETSKQVPITINGDTTVEGDEDFLFILEDATGGATIDGDNALATGTITNDDTAGGGDGGGGGGGTAEQRYVLVGGDGSVYPFNTAHYGDLAGKALNQPVIGLMMTPTGKGYWLVAKDGGIFTFGDAKFFGSMGDQKLNAPVLGMEATVTGGGYWLYAADGGIFTFGDAKFHGSTGNMTLNAPMIGMETTSSGDGYWLVAQDGGIFTFGGAPFYGSTGSMKLNQPVFDMAAVFDESGYWLVARDGGIFTFGSPGFYGSAVGQTTSSVIGMRDTPSGKGYWIADAAGKVMVFGDALFLGDLRTRNLPAPIVGFAAVEA